MKTKLLLSLSILSFVVLSCNNKEINALREEINVNSQLVKKNNNLITGFINRYQDNEKFLSSILNTQNFNKESNLEVLMPIDCDTDKIQAFHIDLVNQFGVLGSIKLNKKKNAIDSIKLRLQEITTRQGKYDLLSAKYDKPTIDSRNIVTHHFTVNIEKGNQRDKYIDVDLGALKFMKKGHKIAIHIDSKDSDINTKNEGSISILTDFGDNFCRGIVVNP